MSALNLLMIEDDARLADMVSAYLGGNGLQVHHCADAASGLAVLQAAAVQRMSSDLGAGAAAIVPELVILDLMLPDLDGLEVCRRLRALPGPVGQTPVLMLTAKGDSMDRIIGLEIGADDYLPKPFEPRELLARIRAILRRRPQPMVQQDGALGAGFGSAATTAAAIEPVRPLLRFGSLEIDRDARTVTVTGRVAELTSYQFDLLVALAERAGRVLTRDQIMEVVRGRELEAFDRSIDVHMGRIRAAIETDPKTPKRILTVRGVGYVFARQQD